MMQSNTHSKIIKALVANTVDIHHEDCIQSFIKDGKLNIDALLRHNLTKITVVYQAVWNHLYGTWASKKDVMSFYDDVLNIKSNYQRFDVTLDMNFLNAIIAHEPFFLARMGAVHRTSSLRDAYVAVVSKFDGLFPLAFICDSIQQRWKHRFNTSDVDMMSQTSMLKTFIKYQLSDVASLTEDCHEWSNVTGYVAECRELDNVDFKYMNKNEVIQYHIYRDNRFMLQLASQVVVVIDNDSQACNESNDLLLRGIHKYLKKNIVVLNLVDCDNFQQTSTIARFNYNIDSYMFHLLPRIATKFYLVSDRERATTLKLCTIPSDSFLITNNIHLSHEQKSNFSFLMTFSKERQKPSESVYFFPCTDYGESYKELVLSAMYGFFTQRCPFQTNNARDNGLQYASFITQYLDTHFKNMIDGLKMYEEKSGGKGKQIAVVSVDNRFNALTMTSVLISLWNIVRHTVNTNGDEKYVGVVYSSKEGCHKYKELIDTLGLSRLVVVKHWEPFDNVVVFHMEDYNAIMKDARFWKSILLQSGCEKCIIVQDDGFILNGEGIGDYLDYDYVGAPWADVRDNAYIKQNINAEMVGNGGFSLRNILKMIEVCEQCSKADKNALFYYNINEIPEDVFFVKHLKAMKANIAPLEVAKRFSVEQILTDKPIGFHKFWMYHPPMNVDKLFESFLR